jgi:hypothetical protein
MVKKQFGTGIFTQAKAVSTLVKFVGKTFYSLTSRKRLPYLPWPNK